MADPIPLGPFDLLEPIGRGGMGVVWQGLHRRQRVPVAIKILSGEGGREPDTLKSFRNEVQSVAGLSHPGIIMVLDQGVTDPNTARLSGGRIPDGCPYMAMELASGGSLSNVIRFPIPWSDIKQVLLSLLDALAHAHARGVLHRDLKPGNVLICAGTDLSPGLKLSDFGIATAIDWHTRSGSLVTVAGTLHYMAPEQLLGVARDFGPWTDLYALGCLAYRMVSGKLPFQGKRGSALMRAQLMERPPPVEPRVAVPDGFASWLRRMMKKTRRARFQRAADAAWSLTSLTDPPGEPAPSMLFRPRSPELEGSHSGWASREQARPALVQPELATLVLDESSQDLSVHLELVTDEQPRQQGVRIRRGPPPLPKTWRRKTPLAPPIQLIGAGLGLYGLRSLPFVGRTTERDSIWEALEAVHKNRTTELVLIKGTAGTGKTRLASWICERAHEVGAATVMKVRREADVGPTTSLSLMVSRYLRCTRLERGEIEERVEDFLGDEAIPQSVQALVELMHPAQSKAERERPGWAPVDTAEKRYLILRAFLDRVATERPLVLFLEDVHADSDALAFAAHLLRTRMTATIPMLILATAREDVLVESLAAAARVDGLLKLRGARLMQLGPLENEQHHQLVQQLLGMDGTLAARVEKRTEGNPFFAVELVGDWVERGILEVGPSGFQLATGADIHEIPEEIARSWEKKVRRALEDLPGVTNVYLQRAAVLGQRVDREEWREACYAHDRADSDGLRAHLEERLAMHKLLVEEKDGFSFSNAMIRESILLQARSEGTWKAHHLACAQIVTRKLEGRPEHLGRVGRHLYEAGEYQEAIEPLLQGAKEIQHLEGARSALGLVAEAEEALRAAGAGEGDPRWGEVWNLRCALFRSLMNFTEALRWSGKIMFAARRQGWTDLLPEAMREHGLALAGARRFSEARSLLTELELMAAEREDTRMLAGAHHGLGLLAAIDQNVPRARKLLLQAADEFRQVEEELSVAVCLRTLAAHDRNNGEELFREALRIYRRYGRAGDCGACWNGLADYARQRGDLQTAEAGYQRSLALCRSVGQDVSIITLNLALVQLESGKLAEARRTASDARRGLEEVGRTTLLAGAHAALMPCAAHDEDWAAWDYHEHQLTESLKASGFHDPDLAWTLDYAGQEAHRQGQPKRAYHAYQLALTQRMILGDTDEVERLTRVLDGLTARLQDHGAPPG